MMNNTFYNEILTDHNLHPAHKKKLEDANLVLEGVNPSCGDDIILELKEENGVITDGAFVGSGCAISQASVDIDRKSTRLNSSHVSESRMPSSA